MKLPFPKLRCAAVVLAGSLTLFLRAQTPEDPAQGDPGQFGQDGPPFGPGDFPRFGSGGPGGRGPMQEKQKLVKQFDKDGDGRLNKDERRAARDFLNQQGLERRRPGGPRGPGFPRRNENAEPPQPGPKLSSADVKSFPDAPLYDAQTLRTFFLEFEDADWEKELADFKNTDVEVPARLVVDGKTYPDVGVHFRGMSSFMMVGEGSKRSLNVSLDFVHEGQKIGGYHTLNLLNSHEDPTFLRSILSYQIAREYIPAPRANFARVVINGESWGIYVNAEQFNKDFVREWFGTTKGARWKVPGSPHGRGSLAYLGDDAVEYQGIYEIKSKDDAKSWADLIRFCKVLNETPADQLEKALEPLLDIDGALKFLALQNALINNDGYWIRTSDYSIYEDVKGRFHILPQDSNENFLRPEGPGFGGRRGPRGGPGAPGRPGFDGAGATIKGVELDPLISASDASKPLISKLLAVPSLRARYLGYVRDIAGRWLDWDKLGPIAAQYHGLIAGDVRIDTRKLNSTDDFLKGLTEDIQGNGGGPFGGHGTISLKNFADQRRAFLLKTPDVRDAEK